MRKLGFALMGAAALAMASAASATITVDFSSMSYTGPTTFGDEHDDRLLRSRVCQSLHRVADTHQHAQRHLLDLAGSTSSTGVDFTSAILSDGINNYDLSFVGSVGTNEFWGLDDTLLDAGQYTLTINGNNGNTGTLGGTITITDQGFRSPRPGR